MSSRWNIFGIPVLGVILPFIGKRRLPLNRDGSYVDTGEACLEDEVGYYYLEPVVFEWLGFGFALTQAYVHLTTTGEIVEPEWDVAGG
jgi:hypothetical protein